MQDVEKLVEAGVGGVPEVAVSGESGELVPAGDADALAGAIDGLIANPVRRRSLGAAAKVRAHSLFSADAIVPRYEELYRRVCATA